MSGEMTVALAREFGTAWNSHDVDLVTSYFAEHAEYHASLGSEHLGASYIGVSEIRKGIRAFFERFPDGRFENLQVMVFGDFGTFEWNFLATDAQGLLPPVAIC